MTKFEKSVKTRLIELGKNQKWLMAQVKTIYKGSIDSSVMTRAIKGDTNVYPQVKIAIAKVLGIKF